MGKGKKLLQKADKALDRGLGMDDRRDDRRGYRQDDYGDRGYRDDRGSGRSVRITDSVLDDLRREADRTPVGDDPEARYRDLIRVAVSALTWAQHERNERERGRGRGQW